MIHQSLHAVTQCCPYHAGTVNSVQCRRFNRRHYGSRPCPQTGTLAFSPLPSGPSRDGRPDGNVGCSILCSLTSWTRPGECLVLRTIRPFAFTVYFTLAVRPRPCLNSGTFPCPSAWASAPAALRRQWGTWGLDGSPQAPQGSRSSLPCSGSWMASGCTASPRGRSDLWRAIPWPGPPRRPLLHRSSTNRRPAPIARLRGPLENPSPFASG